MEVPKSITKVIGIILKQSWCRFSHSLDILSTNLSFVVIKAWFSKWLTRFFWPCLPKKSNLIWRDDGAHLKLYIVWEDLIWAQLGLESKTRLTVASLLPGSRMYLYSSVVSYLLSERRLYLALISLLASSYCLSSYSSALGLQIGAGSSFGFL